MPSSVFSGYLYLVSTISDIFKPLFAPGINSYKLWCKARALLLLYNRQAKCWPLICNSFLIPELPLLVQLPLYRVMMRGVIAAAETNELLRFMTCCTVLCLNGLIMQIIF